MQVIMKKKVLFICQENKLRSRTAEHMYKYTPGLEVRSAGISRDADVSVSRELMEWADIVFVMEKRHRNILHAMYPDLYDTKQIVCLYIPDIYDYNDPVLVSLLEERLRKYIGEPQK
jgi:predicted protein tyrosine phosphatase